MVKKPYIIAIAIIAVVAIVGLVGFGYSTDLFKGSLYLKPSSISNAPKIDLSQNPITSSKSNYPFSAHISGSANIKAIALTLYGKYIQIPALNSGGYTKTTLFLTGGKNNIYIQAKDANGLSASKELTVLYPQITEPAVSSDEPVPTNTPPADRVITTPVPVTTPPNDNHPVPTCTSGWYLNNNTGECSASLVPLPTCPAGWLYNSRSITCEIDETMPVPMVN